SSVERYCLVDDFYAAMLAGRASAADFFAFCRTFDDERDLIVWRVLVGRLRFLARFVGSEDRARFGAAVGALLAPVAGEVGWQPGADESGRTRELRAVVLDALGTIADDPETIARAREVHTQELAGTGRVDADVAAACVSIVSHHGRDDDFDAFVDRYEHAP